jgi:hypothetical protein
MEGVLCSERITLIRIPLEVVYPFLFLPKIRFTGILVYHPAKNRSQNVPVRKTTQAGRVFHQSVKVVDFDMQYGTFCW